MLEIAIATAVLIIGVLALLGVLSLSMTGNWNQGDRATRTTEYAQDKMEQLLSSGWAGLTPGGSVPPTSPVTGYVDYVTNTGTTQTTATGAAYTRQWLIAVNAAGNLKTITIVVSAVTSLGGGATAPSMTLVCTMSSIQ